MVLPVESDALRLACGGPVSALSSRVAGDCQSVSRRERRNLAPIFELNGGKESKMDQDRTKGMAEKATGSIKEAAGKLSGDAKLQAEGKADKAKGAAHNAVGSAKDAIRENTK